MRNGRTRGESRSSALWGTGSRGGEARANALWGRGGRQIIGLTIAAFVLAIPFAASADSGSSASPGNAYVAPGMLSQAKAHPNTKIRVIVTADEGTTLPKSKILDKSLGKLHRNLGLIDGVALDMPAKQLAELSQIDGITITPDAPAHPTGAVYSSKQLWVPNTGIDKLWNAKLSPTDTRTLSDITAPTIAIVDSGIDTTKVADFGARVVQQVNLCSLPNNSPGDGRGHGTFVAGIAGGQAPGYAGASPRSNLVSLDVMDDTGTARTSDVIAAAQWILANKATYNIRVANFSLHSSTSSSFTRDPLDKAVEKLWLNGVTVVAAAGNYGTPNGPSGVKYAPGNDPFVVTVGAADMDGDPSPRNDTAPAWSAYGYTNDGFAKPEVAADGRYMVGPIPMSSSLASLKASNIVSPGYIQLSGTSFAAPIVSGLAAQILAKHPEFTPDQVKGVLMESARATPLAAKGSTGLGEVNAVHAILVDNPPNPNRALDRYLTTDPAGGSMFDAAGWSAAVGADVSWDAVSWGDVSWGDSTLAAVSWADVAWSDVSWADGLVSSDVSWADLSSADSSYEDAAEGDVAGDPTAYTADSTDIAQAAADPDLQLPADLVGTTTGP